MRKKFPDNREVTIRGKMEITIPNSPNLKGLREVINWFFISIGIKTMEIFSDDPYYCGLRARIPNFVKKKKKNSTDSNASSGKKSSMNTSSSLINLGVGKQGAPQVAQHHPFWWHSRLYSDNHHPGQFSKFWSFLKIFAFSACFWQFANFSRYWIFVNNSVSFCQLLVKSWS